MIRPREYLICFVTGLTLSAVTPVYAQDAAGEDNVLEEVVVTATKMGGTAQETPIAISVLTGDALIESGITDIHDLPNVAPGVEVENGFFGPVIAIRGITTTDSTPKGNEGIGYTINGINVGRPRERALAFFDIERIEVLRGPQGTLFGKATSGGVVSVVTRRPGEEFGGKIDLELSNFNTIRTTAGLDMPVSDNVKLRLALNSNNSEGWIEPVLGNPDYRLPPRQDEDDRAARLSAIVDFTDTQSLFLSATLGQRRGLGDGGIPFGVYQNESGSAQREVFGNFVAPHRDQDFRSVTAEYTARLGVVDMTYVGGIRVFEDNTIQSGTDDAQSQGEYGWRHHDNEGIETTSHELRFNGQNERLNWVAGLNWWDEDIDESNHTWDIPVIPGVPLDIRNSENGIHPFNKTWHESSGVFGQLNYDLSEDLTLTVGARWSEDGVSRRGTFALGSGYPPGPRPPGLPPNGWLNPDGEPCRAPDPCIGVPNNADQENTKVTYRLGLDYDVSDTGMIYGSIATGYKAGGFSDFGPAGPLAGADYYSPEDLIAYEAGYKGDVTDTLTYNTSVFFYDYEVMQLSYVREVAFATFVLFTVTAPTEVSGWENELSWRPDDQSQLDLELRLGDSQYVDFDAGARGNTPFGPGVPFTPWDGFALDRMPEAAGAVTYSRNFSLENGATLSGRIRTKYSSGYLMSNIPNAFQYEQGSFTRTDLNLTYRSADQRLGIGLFLRNLEDELQATSGIGGFRPPGRENEITVNVNRPRTYGITLAYDF